MQAAIVERYGPPEVVHIVELPRPTPRTGEVLVRVIAAAVTSADARIRAAHFPRGCGVPGRLVFGLRGPRRPVLGSAFSGVVAELGPGVAGLAVGDAVCGMPGMRLGAHAEYLTIRADLVSRRPVAVSDDDAAGVLFGGSTALHYLRDRAGLRPGEAVLVIGAEVAALTSAPNAARVGALGAHRMIDYRQHAPERRTGRFDAVLDAVGNLSIEAGRCLLRPEGRLLLVVADLGQPLQARGNVMAGPAPERPADAQFLLGLVAAGTLRGGRNS